MHGSITSRPNSTNANREKVKTNPVCIFPSSCLCLYITQRVYITGKDNFRLEDQRRRVAHPHRVVDLIPSGGEKRKEVVILSVVCAVA